MLAGKVWIYKRATFYPQNSDKGEIIDYTDGTEPFNSKVEGTRQNPVYIWKIPGYEEAIQIPLNVSRNRVDSILRKEVIELPDRGDLHLEYMFGKFRTYPQFYFSRYFYVFPFLLIILILVMS